MSTSIATVTDARTDRAAFEPTSLSEALHVSQVLVASRLLPRAIQTPEAAFAVIATGRELGLSAMQALRAIHIVEGKPTLSADLMVALVKRSPECSFFRMVESTGERATYETQRRGEPSPTRLSFTMDEARASGAASKDNWRKYAAAMLRARASSGLARAVYPDLVLGVYDPDELDVRDVTPPSAVTVSAERVAVPQVPMHARPAPVTAKAPTATQELAAESAPVAVEPAETPTDPSAIDRLVGAIEGAADIEAACITLDAGRASVDPSQLPVAFLALMDRCTALTHTNRSAAVLAGWKASGLKLPDEVTSHLRQIFTARRAKIQGAA